MTDSRVQLASIFRRGGHKQELLGNEALPEQQELSQQLQQLAVAWALPKAKKGLGAAVWRPLLGAFEVIKRGSHQYHGQGFMRNKKLYLNIEEAVFLMDQCVLLLLLEPEGGQQQLLSMQEAIHMMVQLGVCQDRLQVLSHLSRLGFHVKRHPACWLVQTDQNPAAAAAVARWQQNPAWQNTDGLPLLLTNTASVEPAAAAAAADNDVDDDDQQQQQQQQASGAVDLVQHEKFMHSVQGPPPPPAAAAAADHKLSRKKRRVDAPATAVATDIQQQQQQQQVLQASDSWWAAVPCWLQQQQQQQQTGSANDLQHNQQFTGEQQQQQQDIALVPLGVQLRQQFPNLRPLPTYQPHSRTDCDLRVQQQQQQQQGAIDDCDHDHHHWQQQQQSNLDHLPTPATHDMVYDVLPVDPNFSHYSPAAPRLSVAMPKPGCEHLPGLDELLQLMAEAPSPPPAAAGGGGVRAVGPSYKSVMFGIPDGGDVNFYELKPVQLMNMITNEH